MLLSEQLYCLACFTALLLGLLLLVLMLLVISDIRMALKEEKEVENDYE